MVDTRRHFGLRIVGVKIRSGYMAPVTVLIVGCGVVGPVRAVLLKRKGYNQNVFEKVKKLGDAGASLILMPNGSAHNDS